MELPWGWPIAFYLYLGGVSGGTFVAAAALKLVSDKAIYRRLVTLAAWAALIPMVTGLGLLIYDLGRPDRFISVLLTPNPASPMSLGSLIIGLYTPVPLLFTLSYTGFVEHFVKDRKRLLEGFRTFLASVGILLAFMTATYTGVLLSATHIFLWASLSLAPMFLASSLAAGFGLFTVIAVATVDVKANRGFFTTVNKVDLMLVTIDVATIIIFLFSLPTASVLSILSFGGYGLLFWVVAIAIGDAIPLSIGIYELFKKKPMTHLLILVANLDMIGGFFLKFVVVYAGQLAVYA